MKTKMNNQQSSLDKFGEFIVVNLRDKAIETAEMLLENGSKSPHLCSNLCAIKWAAASSP